MFPGLDQSLWAVVIAAAVALITAGAALIGVGKDKESFSTQAMFGLGLFLMTVGILLAGWALISIFLPVSEPTPTVEVNPACSRFNARGDDNDNKEDEYVCFTNQGSQPADMTGWTLKDESEWMYPFPASCCSPEQV